MFRSFTLFAACLLPASLGACTADQGSLGDDRRAAQPLSSDVDAEADAEQPAPQCNAVEQRASTVDAVRKVPADTVQLAGGTIQDGTYVLVQSTHGSYVGERGTEPGQYSASPWGRETVRIAGGQLEQVFEDATGTQRGRFTATLTVNGSSLLVKPSCVWSSTSPKAVLPSGWSDLAYPLGQNHFETTGATLTIWAKLGNHGSSLRVYRKIE